MSRCYLQSLLQRYLINEKTPNQNCRQKLILLLFKFLLPFVQSTTSATSTTQMPCHQYPPSVLDARWSHHRNNTVVLSQIIVKSRTSSSSNFRFCQINNLRNSSVVSSVRLCQHYSNFKVHQLWTPIHLLHHLQIMKSRKTKKQFTKGQCPKEKNVVLAVGRSVGVRK